MRWWEYLSRFNDDTIHVDGDRNRVADALSRYYKYDTAEDKHPDKEFVKADKVLDPKGELLPVERFVEIRTNVIRKSRRLRDKPSDAVAESVAINNTNTTRLRKGMPLQGGVRAPRPPKRGQRKRKAEGDFCFNDTQMV